MLAADVRLLKHDQLGPTVTPPRTQPPHRTDEAAAARRRLLQPKLFNTAHCCFHCRCHQQMGQWCVCVAGTKKKKPSAPPPPPPPPHPRPNLPPPRQPGQQEHMRTHRPPSHPRRPTRRRPVHPEVRRHTIHVTRSGGARCSSSRRQLLADGSLPRPDWSWQRRVGAATTMPAALPRPGYGRRRDDDGLHRLRAPRLPSRYPPAPRRRIPVARWRGFYSLSVTSVYLA